MSFRRSHEREGTLKSAQGCSIPRHVRGTRKGTMEKVPGNSRVNGSGLYYRAVPLVTAPEITVNFLSRFGRRERTTSHLDLAPAIYSCKTRNAPSSSQPMSEKDCTTSRNRILLVLYDKPKTRDIATSSSDPESVYKLEETKQARIYSAYTTYLHTVGTDSPQGALALQRYRAMISSRCLVNPFCFLLDCVHCASGTFLCHRSPENEHGARRHRSIDNLPYRPRRMVTMAMEKDAKWRSSRKIRHPGKKKAACSLTCLVTFECTGQLSLPITSRRLTNHDLAYRYAPLSAGGGEFFSLLSAARALTSLPTISGSWGTVDAELGGGGAGQRYSSRTLCARECASFLAMRYRTTSANLGSTFPLPSPRQKLIDVEEVSAGRRSRPLCQGVETWQEGGYQG